MFDTDESWDEKMPIIIEQIIEIEQKSNNELIKIQQKRIRALLDVKRRQSEGKHIQTKRIIESLQSSGILDSDGNLASPYNNEDKK